MSKRLILALLSFINLAILEPSSAMAQTGESKPIVCHKTNFVPPVVNNYKPTATYNLLFSAAECGGTLPTSDYYGFFMNEEICGRDDGWLILSSENGYGASPGVQVGYYGECPSPASGSNIKTAWFHKNSAKLPSESSASSSTELRNRLERQSSTITCRKTDYSPGAHSSIRSVGLTFSTSECSSGASNQQSYPDSSYIGLLTNNRTICGIAASWTQAPPAHVSFWYMGGCTSTQGSDIRVTYIATRQCQDGLDNDSDGLIDMSDPGCSSPQDDNESDGTSQCQDGLDNDSDGATDFPNDFSCSTSQDNDETNPRSQCQDGLDNDNDGATDLVDPGCSTPQDNDESNEPVKISLSTECVLDNFNGTKTAFFSYNNATAQTISIAVGNTSSPTTRNDVSPGGPNLAQPTSFTPGITKGAFSVALSGTSVTWTIRPLGGAVSTATASAASPACAKVQPLAECQGFDNGVLRVLGGYQNLNNFEVKIPIGALNNFSPGNQNQGQPEKFLSGLNKGAFNINLPDTSTVLMWTLNGLQAVASTALPICSGECVDTPVGSITEQIDQLAVQIAALTKQAAAILSSAEATVAKTSKVSSKKKTRTQARIAASADRVDAERATAKANGYVTQSQELTIQIPDVVKNCPEAPQLCQTVDNGPTIDALRNLFAQARNTAQRTIARAYFRNTGATTRKDSLVAQAKSLESQGLAQLDQIPRTSTECQ